MAAQYGYIGNNPANTPVVIAKQRFEPTGVQTSFIFAAGYRVGYLDLYLNGSRLIEALDYTATDGSTVDLASAAQGGDVLEVIAYKAFNVAGVTTVTSTATVYETYWQQNSVGINTTSNVGIGTTTSNSKLTVSGDVSVSGIVTANNLTVSQNATITGNLTVNGTQTIINTQVLDVSDKTIGIGSTSSPSDSLADGAGIIVYGTTNKSLTWSNTTKDWNLVGGGLSVTDIDVTNATVGIITATTIKNSSGVDLTNAASTGKAIAMSMIFGG